MFILTFIELMLGSMFQHVILSATFCQICECIKTTEIYYIFPLLLV